jgi:uncharacterized BrkB/YihY/UPF0761 family membrane protein
MVVSGLGIFVLFLYVGGFLFIIGALIYFINKRIKDKEKEDFEKRNN